MYRHCLRIVSSIGRHLQTIVDTNNTSLHWLLVRTQAIGEAGDNNTANKHEIQQLKSRIKEIFHRKFLWNNTSLSIDGPF